MDVSFVEQLGTKLSTTVREYDAAADVEGILVLAADEAGAADTSALDTVAQEISTPVFGGLFPGILYAGERYTEGAVVAALPVEPTTTVVTGLSDPDRNIRPQLSANVVAPGETTAFVFVDGYASRIGTFVQRLFESYGVECRFLGGGAGSLTAEDTACVVTGEGVLADAAVLATLPLGCSLGVRHGWQDVDGPFRVNEADGTRLSMLADGSAFDVYRRVVEADSGTQLTRANFFEKAKSYPFGLSRLHEEKIVRDPFKVDDDGSITCFGDVPEGEFLHVLSGNPDSLVDAARKATGDAIATGGEGPLTVFDCISRVLYLEDRFDEELAAIGGPADPTLGALTIGEVANGDGGHLEFYNKTTVVARIEDQ